MIVKSSPEVEALVLQLAPLAKQFAYDNREFILLDLNVGPLEAGMLRIAWPMIVEQGTPTSLRVSIDLLFDVILKMPQGQFQAILQNYRAFKATS